MKVYIAKFALPSLSVCEIIASHLCYDNNIARWGNHHTEVLHVSPFVKEFENHAC